MTNSRKSFPTSRVWSRLRAMARLGRRTAPAVPALGWTALWFRKSFLRSQNYLILLSVVIGILTGLGSVGFIHILNAVSRFAREGVGSALGMFGPANLVLVPAMGGLMVGPLIERFAREAKGHGVPEVMTALASRGGRIRKRVVMVKVLASSLTIGFGGAAGREGPMVHIGSAIGSSIGQLVEMSTANLRTLVACGAAGGVAATFNAPIAGAIFAVETHVALCDERLDDQLGHVAGLARRRRARRLRRGVGSDIGALRIVLIRRGRRLRDR